MLSGDSEGKVILWEQIGERDVSPFLVSTHYQFKSIISWDAHPKSSISALGFAVRSEGVLILLTGASDGAVRVWKVAGETVEEVQKIEYKGKLPLDIVVGTLPGSTCAVTFYSIGSG